MYSTKLNIMKDIYLKIFICLLFISAYHISTAQSLIIDGRFFSNSDKNITAKYILTSNHKVIKTGRRRKIKVDLSLNKDYMLIISKEGYNTRSISFSTKTVIEDNFIFAFDVTLNKLAHAPDSAVLRKQAFVNVFYDYRTNQISYVCTNKN